MIIHRIPQPDDNFGIWFVIYVMQVIFDFEAPISLKKIIS